MKYIQRSCRRVIQTFALALLFGTGLFLRAEEPINADLNAIEATQPIAASDLPAAAIFYSAQNPNLPATPGNFDFLPAWYLSNGVYLIDNIDSGMRPMDAPAPPGDGGGGDGGTNSDSYSGWPFPTNGLWMQINGITNGIVSMALNNATDVVYEILSTTNLLTGWNVETEVWPTNTSVMPFTVPVLNRTNNLFFWAQDWTGVTENGNTTPNWWLWMYFGTLDLSDTNLDWNGNGQTLLADYEYDIDPNMVNFSFSVTNEFVNSMSAPVQLNIVSGVPYYQAVLVDDTNFADANWQPYASSNLTVNLGSIQGWHGV